MNLYLRSFRFPSADEEVLIIQKRMRENAGALGYIDNIYPCCIFPEKELFELEFSPITLLYGGNGSGKSTAPASSPWARTTRGILTACRTAAAL